MVPVNTKGNNDFYSWHDILYTACLAKCFIVTEEALNTWSHRHFISALRTQLFLRRASAPREKQKSGLSVTALGFFYFLTYPFCMCVCVCLLVCVCVCILSACICVCCLIVFVCVCFACCIMCVYVLPACMSSARAATTLNHRVFLTTEPPPQPLALEFLSKDMSVALQVLLPLRKERGWMAGFATIWFGTQPSQCLGDILLSESANLLRP